MSYKGQGDVFDIGGHPTFAGEHRTGKDYAMQFSNTSAVDQVVAIAPALMLGLSTAAIMRKVTGIDAFLTKDGSFEDSEGADIKALADPDGGVTGAITAKSLGSSGTIDYMLNFVAHNPSRIVRMNLQSDNKDQFSTVIEQAIISPFVRANSDMQINLRDHVSSDQFQSDRAEIALLAEGKVLTLAPDAVILLTLKANSSLQVNWDIGAVASSSYNFRRRSAIAHANINNEDGGPFQAKR